MTDGSDWGWELFMVGLWLLFFLVIALTVIKYLKGYQLSDREKPLDIAKTRYAKGEITGEAFERMMKDLQ